MANKNGQRKDRRLTQQSKLHEARAKQDRQLLQEHFNRCSIRARTAQIEIEQLGEGWTERPPNIQVFLRMLVLGFRIGMYQNILNAAQNGQIITAVDRLDEDMKPLARYLADHPELAEELWNAGT